MKPEYEPKTIEQKFGYLIEECGEVLAAAGKTIRWGLESTNPELPPSEQETNRDWLLREIEDLDRAMAYVWQELQKGGARYNMNDKKDCYQKAAPNEPRFTLIGRDPVAAVTIQFWIALRKSVYGPQDPDQLTEASEIMLAMDEWAQELGKGKHSAEAWDAAKRLAPKVFGE